MPPLTRYFLDTTPATMIPRVPLLLSLLALIQGSEAFVPIGTSRDYQSTRLFAEDVKAAPLVSGEELELILTDLEKPLVIDAYATW